MAAGNQHLGYKDGAERHRGTVAGYQGRVLPGLPRPHGRPCWLDDPWRPRDGLGPCERCGAPTTGDVCVLPSRRAGGPTSRCRWSWCGGRADASRCGPDGGARGPGRSRAGFAYGDKVLVLDTKGRRYLATLKEGGEFHTHAGFFPHAELIGQPEGTVVKANRGTPYTVMRPTLEDFVIEMPRGAQVIYPKDLGPILHAGRHRARGAGAGVRRRVGRAVDDDAAQRRRHRRLRAAGGLRRTGPGPTCARSSARTCWTATGSSCATATTASTRSDSTAWCSTCPSRGRWCRTPRRRCGPGGSSSPTRRRSSRPASSGEALARSAAWLGSPHPGGAAPDLAHRGPGGAPRPPDGRPHRLPHLGPLPVAVAHAEPRGGGAGAGLAGAPAGDRSGPSRPLGRSVTHSWVGRRPSDNSPSNLWLRRRKG